MPYIGALSAKIDHLKEKAVKKIFLDAQEKSNDFQKEMRDSFEAADADKDDLLNIDEYIKFEKARCEYQTQKYV